MSQKYTLQKTGWTGLRFQAANDIARPAQYNFEPIYLIAT